MSNNSVNYIKSFFDSTSNVIYFVVLGLLLIVITYGTGIIKSGGMSLLIKTVIVGLYLYIFTIVFKSLTPIYNINGLFLDTSLSKVKFFFLLYCLFLIALVLLIFYIFYTIFK